MKIQVVKTRKFLPPKDDLRELILKSIKKLEENAILVITSKVVSISEGNCIRAANNVNRDELAKKESELYLPRKNVPGEWFLHTIKNNHLIASAGIDKSNAGNYYILWPKSPYKSAEKLWNFLRKSYKVKNLGVIITDSHSVPFHRGLVGMSIAHFGFEPLRDYRGEKDIFGNELLMSQANIPDSLAAASVFSMGEGAEQTPIAIISDINGKIKFDDYDIAALKRHPGLVSGSRNMMLKQVQHDSDSSESYEVPFKKDLFYPFLRSVKWKKGGIREN
ncbi:hypothetical protein A3F00_01790 [Candidatus Daviesbacteria bacterium RIFCSPHIGHO2_12_FULL_37_11]|uniref:Coenzyme F420:L-glutamate ligase-like domain-containing protein n=1 Tax=Candidatus Daviesbacteria bacterium RIFCSPHIGHO2_12_FULL_37_11 TaxID=1797777 RepID=A0A1F5KDN7_9BACT|nr:MAG: hypothetical protein A3F00_01790 [Candidatus Daviesbacteria bacterium RIFCSPHIGHO2_12_FULL_37_11]OGE45564.1 MAG: hypothetical protein A3B39_05135 [Candidatus Daviesbacteria bacterium RIFCSPLOWO2_01_FULL_37_10]